MEDYVDLNRYKVMDETELLDVDGGLLILIGGGMMVAAGVGTIAKAKTAKAAVNGGIMIVGGVMTMLRH